MSWRRKISVSVSYTMVLKHFRRPWMNWASIRLTVRFSIWGFRRRKLTMAAADSVSALMRRWICGWIRPAGCLRRNGLQPHPNRIYTRLLRIMVKSGLVARLRAPLLRNGRKVPSIQPASWRSLWRKTSVLVSADKTLQRAPSKQFASLLTASSKR